MKTLWLDCWAGASGDMLLGALVDAGASLDAVRAAVDAVVPGIALDLTRTSRHGIAAAQLSVAVNEAGAVDRRWRDVRALIEAAALADPVRDRALDAFARLARAEAHVHGVDPAEVHFHEVGADDAIADVVGVCAALNELHPDEVVASPITLGGGPPARGQHGLVPVPGPAVLALLADAGAPVSGGSAPYEMTTPTGATLLATLVDSWGPLPPMRVQQIGIGAGARDPAEVPNVLRAVIGDRVDAAHEAPDDSALVLEANVDDLDPRLWPAVLERLLDAGASDAWLVPILMKKGRPAHTLAVLVTPAHAAAVRTVVFTETSTIGLRESTVGKRALDRDVCEVDVDGHRIRVKTASLDGVVVNAQPEYADVALVAQRTGKSLKSVLAAAVAAAHRAGLHS